MPGSVGHANLLLAWLWIVLGFVFGLYLGLNFHRDDWLGGYGSLTRRLYRLGHISFFGLGFVNLLYFFTLRITPLSGPTVGVSSWSFVLGAVTMPICCLLMAHVPRLRPLFALPVTCLTLGGSLTLWEVIR